MEKEYGQLLALLAVKLGTTAEFLWSVLIKQSYISAIIQIGYTVLVFIVGIVLYKIHRKLCTKPPKSKYENDTYYSYFNKAVLIPMIVVTVFYALVVVIMVCCIGDIFTKLISPEYYALNKILNNLKQ